MTKLEQALKLAGMGFHVFPIVPNTKVPPKGFHFKEEATTNKEQVTHWWTNGYTDYNIGISTSKFKESEALLVVDVDTKEGKMGETELLKLELEGLDFPTTLEQTTPSGGRHLIYKISEPVNQPDLAPGINIRAQGGYILGAGSMLGGKCYTLSAGEPNGAPDWLVSRCGRSTRKAAPTKGQRTYNVNQENALRSARFYLENEAPIAEQGLSGDQTTYKVAARVKDFGVEISGAINLMSEVWNGRCLPAWSSDELTIKIENAYRYGEKVPGADAPEVQFKPVANVPKPAKKRIVIEHFDEIDDEDQQDGLVEDYLDQGTMSVIYGESNSGKTFFALDLSLHVALGQPWFGKSVEQGAVIYLAAEGGRGVKKRIKAFRKYHNLEGIKLPFGLIRSPINLLDPNADRNELIEILKEYQVHSKYKVVLLVVDTLARAMGGGNENAPNDMGAFVKNVDLIRDSISAHVMIIHHSGKDVAKGARGHSSLRGATDTEIEIYNNTAKVKKQRDRDFGPELVFKLHEVDLGFTKKGKPRKSCVVLPDNTTAAVKDFSKTPLESGSLMYKGFKSLQNALDWNPVAAPNTLALEDDAVVATLTNWKEEFIKLAYPQGAVKATGDRTFLRMVGVLVDARYVMKNEDYAWLPDGERK